MMLKVYAFSTPNSVKVPIALEEMGLDYELIGVNIRKGAQKAPDFMALNPNAKVPVLVDGDFVLSESAAILVYLAEKSGQLLPPSGPARARVFEQLFFNASGLGPAFGNAGFFRKFAPEPIPLAIDRFGGEALRIVSVLNDLLAKQEFVAGDALSIADIVHFSWLWRRQFAEVSIDAAPNVQRWYDALAARPAFQRAIERTMALAEG